MSMSDTLVDRYTPTNTRNDHYPAPVPEIISVEDWFPEIRPRHVHNRPADVDVNRPAQPQTRQPPEIIIIDSDDEEVQITGHNRPQPPRRALFSPPPPPAREESVPPVPAIPAHFRERRHIHRQARPPAPLDGLFVPMEHAFDFEMRGQPHQPPRIPERRQQPYIDLPAMRPHPPAGPAVGVAGPANPPPPRPGMGLGGALYALNRQDRVQAEGAARVRNEFIRRNEHNGWFAAFPRHLREFFMLDVLGPPERRVDGNVGGDHNNQHAGEPAWPAPDGWQDYNPTQWDRAPAWMVGFNDLNEGNDGGAGAGKAPEYRASYTHPPKAQSGFTHNFEVPDEVVVIDLATSSISNSSSSSQAKTTTAPGPILACACCTDTLVMNVSGSEEEQRSRRIWGLRCGHILDGKCVERLMRPTPIESLDGIKDIRESTPDAVANSSTTSQKRNYEESNSLDYSHPVRKSRRLDKGKGKAKAEPGLATLPSFDGEPTHEEEHAVNEMLLLGSGLSETGPSSSASTGVNDMRSRLRPRRVPEIVAEPSSVAGNVDSRRPFAHARPHQRHHTAVAGPSSTSASSTSHRKPRVPRGRKAAARAGPTEEVLELYEWRCPVPGCARVHVSERVRTRTVGEGGELKEKEEWRMHAERGAIGVYV